ncbi:DUF4836 family protein [Bacteroides sedimenti]|uniref:DUF4836 domain-containing protein n=1 Tax=Bacteroides sedimenti TaxID=2136147 RepID=A0ABM8IGE6_9BACE
MNTQKFFFRLSVLMLAVLLLGSCSKDKEYSRVIPSNSPVVVSLNVQSIITKGGLLDGKESIIKQMTASMNNQKLARLIQNPSKAGLSIKDNAYFFMTSEKEPGLVLRVTDKSDLEDAIKLMQADGMCDPLEKGTSYSWTVLHGYGICAFDNSSLLLLKTTNARSLPVKEHVEKLMTQSENVGISSNKGFQKMVAKKSDIGMFYSFASMPDITSLSMKMGLPEGTDMRDLMTIVAVNFENGKIAADCEYYTENDSLMAYIKKQSEMSGYIKQAFLNRFPSSSLMFLTASVKGDRLYKVLSSSQEFKNMVQSSRFTPGLDLKKSITALNGDVSMAISSFSEKGIPSFLAYAEVTDPAAAGILYAFKSDFDQVGMTISSSGKNEYLVKSAMFPSPIHFGVRGNYFYLTNDENLYKNIGKEVAGSMAGARYEAVRNKTKGYFILDMENIMNLPLVNGAFDRFGSQGKMVHSILSKFSYMEAYNVTENKGVINIFMKNKDENVLKQLIVGLQGVLGQN